MAEAPPWLINLARSSGYDIPAEARGVSTAAVLAYLFINKGRGQNKRPGNLRQAILEARISGDEVRQAYEFVKELENEKPLPLRLWALEERTTGELAVMLEQGPREWPLQIPRTVQDNIKEFFESDPDFLRQLDEMIALAEQRKSIFDARLEGQKFATRSPVEDAVYFYNRFWKRLQPDEITLAIETRRQDNAARRSRTAEPPSLKSDAAALYGLFGRLKRWQKIVIVLCLIAVALMLYLVS